MKNKYLVVSLALVLLAAVVLNAVPARPGMERGRARRGLAMAGMDGFIPLRLLLQAGDKIGLSADQEKKLRAMGEAHQQWLIKARAEMEIKAVKLRGVLSAEPLNMKEAEALIREQSSMRAEMQITRLRQQQEVKSVLSAEQLEKLAELKKEFRAEGRERMRQRMERRQERMH
jgi:Spy/CpxP family protein refolding chaperone